MILTLWVRSGTLVEWSTHHKSQVTFASDYYDYGHDGFIDIYVGF